MDEVLVSTGLIIGLGVAAQVLARVLRVPALIILLAMGVLVGPVLGWLDPRATFGDDILFPLVSLGVGLLLFEGGLALRFSELLPAIRRPVVLLVTTGVAVTLLVAAMVSYALIDIDGPQALLLGAIVTVSGPTVVMPLLAAARPRPPTSTMLRWEGILIDPIGATVAVTVLNGYFGRGQGESTALSAGVLITGAVGIVTGVLGAALVVGLIRVGIPDELQVGLMLATAVVVFVVADGVRSEAGLFGTTVLGVALANQRFFDLREISGFSEHIAVLILGALFVTLAADLDLAALAAVLPQVAILCLALLVVRHVVVRICVTSVRGLGSREKLFMGMIAPRGVVAAATASSFALTLEQRGEPFPTLAPMAYGVVIVMAVLSSLSVPASRLLGVRQADPRGLLLVGSEPWVVRLAEAAVRTGLPVRLLAPGRADLEVLEPSGVVLVDPALDALDRSTVLDDVEYCVVAAGSVESQTYVWSLAREHLGQARVLVVPTPGVALPHGMRRAFPRLEPGELREAEFIVSLGSAPTREPGTRVTSILGVTTDRSLLLRPSDEPGQGQWVVAAEVPLVRQRPHDGAEEWA